MEIEYISQILNDDKLKEWFEKNKLSGDINFNNPDFEKDTTFILNKMKKYRFHYNVMLTYEDIVKRYFIPDEVYKNVYGPYALGYKGAKESDRIYNLKSLCDYIIQHDENYTDVAVSGNIDRYFGRNKSGKSLKEKDGLIRRLYNWEIDIDKYEPIDQCKLLYYIYNIEKPYGQHPIRLFSMLNNPTLENVANTKVDTRNGELMTKMKEDISLEIPFITVLLYNCILIYIIHNLEGHIKKALQFLYYFDDNNSDALARKIKQLPIPGACKIKSNRSQTLFESFYLKLLQHENEGREKDIIDLSGFVYDEFPDQDFSNLVEYRLIKKENVKDYLINNRNELAKVVYNQSQVTNYRKYDEAVEKIYSIIDILELNTFADFENSGIDTRLLITILQVCIFTNKKLNVENSFYRYNSSDKKNVRKEMSKGIDALCKNQLAISKLIWDTYYKKCGKHKLRNILYQYENHIDKTIQVILSCNNLEEMLYTYFENIWDLDSIVFSDEGTLAALYFVNSELNCNYHIKKNYLAFTKFASFCYTEKSKINLVVSEINKHIDSLSRHIFSVNIDSSLFLFGVPVYYTVELNFRLDHTKKEATLCSFNTIDITVL